MAGVVYLDLVLTSLSAALALYIGGTLLLQFHKSAPNLARYAFGMSHIFLSVSLALRLVPMAFLVSPIFGWSSRVFFVLAYMYMAYAFLSLTMPCHAPLIRALTCPFCTLDAIEPSYCKQAVAYTVFRALIHILVFGSALTIGYSFITQGAYLEPAIRGGFFVYARTRMPLGLWLVYLLIQTSICLFIARSVIHTLRDSRAMVLIAMSYVGSVLSSVIYISITLMADDPDATVFVTKLEKVYLAINLVYRSLYFTAAGFVTLYAPQNLFMRQEQRYLLELGDRLNAYTDTLTTSVEEMVSTQR